MTTVSRHRQVFLHSTTGQRVLTEVLGAQLIGLVLKPEPLWLVSPWISNFTLLDNRAGNWDSVEPAWGSREIDFIELLACAVNNGARLSLVTRDDPMNRTFIEQFKKRLNSNAEFRYALRNELHTKGILTRHFFLKGSMNFTWSGMNRNDEYLELNSDPHLIGEALEAFESHYEFADQQDAI